MATSKEGTIRISPEDRKNAVAALLSNDERVKDTAYASLALPLRKAVDKESSARKIFNPVELGDMEDAIFPVDDSNEVEVVQSSAYGYPPISMFVTDIVTVTTHTYQGGWELPEQLAKAGRIDQVARNSRRMLDGFVQKEETQAWSVIDSCIAAGNTISTVGGVAVTTASIELINELIIYFQDLGFIPDQCWMSPRSMGDFRLMCKEAGLPNEVRFDLWKNGMIPGLWGVDFYALRTIADSAIYMVDTSRFGVMPIRQNLETREDPAARSQFKIRVYGQEQFGICAVDKTAICKGSITRAS